MTQSRFVRALLAGVAGCTLCGSAAFAQPASGGISQPGTDNANPAANTGAVGGPVVAGSEPQPHPRGLTGPSSKGSGASIEEVVVTANRTASLASKTPVTLSAISGAALTHAGITNPTQLTSTIPGLAIDRGNANGLQINIRGITSTGTGSPSAAFLVDGIYIPDPNGQEVSFYDLDRVEVLRGPQGTLYGRNTTAGVVNLISASPKSTFGGYLNGDFGNYGNREVTGAINVPINDTLAIRLAGNYDYRDTYYHQIVEQPYKNAVDTDNDSVRLSVLYKPVDSVKVLARVDYTHLSGAGSGLGAVPLLSNFYQVPLTDPATGVREPDPIYLSPSASRALGKGFANVSPTKTNNETWGSMVEADWSINKNLTLTWLGGFRQFSRNDTGNAFFGSDLSTDPPTNAVETAKTATLSNAYSQEERLAYDNGTIKAQGGVYYYHNHNDASLFFNNFSLPLPRATQQSIGVFGQGTYAITTNWRVTGGVRYTTDDVFQTNKTELILPFGPLVLASTRNQGTSSRVTWKAETDYDIGPRTLAYASVATGYKAITFNTNCATNGAPCIVKPEDLTDFEGGVKTRLLHNTLLLNADYFHYNYKNLQLSQIIGQTVDGVVTPSEVTTNAAAALVDGVELEGAYIPFPNSRFDFSASYIYGRYTNYLISDLAGSGNYNGDPLDHSPRVTLSGGYTYTLPLANGGELVANLHTHYSDHYAILNSSVNAQFVQPGFTKTDFTLRYTAPRLWYVEGYVKNMENAVEVTYINTAPEFPALNDGTVNTGDPRTFGVRLGVTF